MGLLRSYLYIKKFKFPTNTVTIAGDVADFPHCVHINTTSWGTAGERTNFFGAWNVNGKRIQFFDKNGVNLPYEVEYYDSASTEAVYWVKKTVLTGDTGISNYIYIAYGNDADGTDYHGVYETYGAQQQAVWNSNFVGVWHMGDNSYVAGDSSSEVKDSTVNGNHGNDVGSTDITGKVRKGRDFVTDDYIEATDINVTALTVSAWMKFDTKTATRVAISKDSVSGGGGREWVINMYTDGTILGYVFQTGSIFNSVQVAGNVCDSVFRHIVMTNNIGDGGDGKTRIYVNAGAANVSSGAITGINNTTSLVTFGKNPSSGTPQYLDGALDEIRISNTARNADFIKLEYQSMLKTNWNGDGWYSWEAQTTPARIPRMGFSNHNNPGVV